MHTTQKWLYINAAFSGICSGTSLIANQQLQSLFQISNKYVFPVLGVGLLLFVAQLLWTARRVPIDRNSVISISIMDGVWVLLSIVIILFQLFELSGSGYLIIAIVAAFVGLFGYQQFKSIQHANA